MALLRMIPTVMVRKQRAMRKFSLLEDVRGMRDFSMLFTKQIFDFLSKMSKKSGEIYVATCNNGRNSSSRLYLMETTWLLALKENKRFCFTL